MFGTLDNLLIYIGLYALSCYLYDNLRSPVLLLLSLRKSQSLKQKYGEWAAITGSTDGIGKAYARELARQGLNVVLISRTKAKLENVALEIQTEFGVQTKIIPADFTKGKEVYDFIESELQDLQVGILVNNVGQSTPKPGPMASFTADDLWNVIYTNIGAVTQLSRLFLRRMKEAGLKGVIVNISSGTEMQPIPYGALYGASKAFTRSLTLALQHEAAPYGITVQLVSPHFVVTKINTYSKRVMRGGFLIPNPTTYAQWAVNTIGRVDETTGYYRHGFESAFYKMFTYRIRTFLAGPVLQYLLGKKAKKSNGK